MIGDYVLSGATGLICLCLKCGKQLVSKFSLFSHSQEASPNGRGIAVVRNPAAERYSSMFASRLHRQCTPQSKRNALSRSSWFLKCGNAAIPRGPCVGSYGRPLTQLTPPPRPPASLFSQSAAVLAPDADAGHVADEVLQRLKSLERLIGPLLVPRERQNRRGGGRSAATSGAVVASDAAVDSILKQLKALHELDVVVPYSYMLDVVSILVQRNDILRTEILLSLAMHNYNANQGAENSSSSSSSGGSKGRFKSSWHQDAFCKLATFALDKLLAANNFSSDSLSFWVRLSSLGYVTGRATLGRILGSLAAPRAVPPLAFIDKAISVVQENLWHQTAEYHTTVLDIYRNYIISGCNDKLSLSVASKRVDNVWGDYKKLARSMDTVIPYHDGCKVDRNKLIEIHCHRIRCIKAIADKAMMFDKEAYESYKSQALEAFDDMLQIDSSKATNNVTLAESATATFQTIKNDVKAMILSAEKQTQPSSSGSSTPVIRLPLFGKAVFLASTDGHRRRSDSYSKEGRNHSLMLASLLSDLIVRSNNIDAALSRLQSYVTSFSEQVNMFGVGSSAESTVGLGDAESVKMLSALKSKLSEGLAGEQRASGVLTDSGKRWLTDVLISILTQITMSSDRFNSALSGPPDGFKSIHENHFSNVDKILEFAKSHSITPTTEFYCEVVASFGVMRDGKSTPNMPTYSNLHNDDRVHRSALELSNTIIERFGNQNTLAPIDTLKVKQSTVRMLCSFRLQSAVDKAVSIMYACIDNPPHSSTSSGSTAIIDEMFLDVSAGGIACYGDDKLTRLSAILNSHIQSNSGSGNDNVNLMVKDLMIQSRLRKGADAYKLLQSISQSQIKSFKTGVGTLDVSVYQSVLSSLYRHVPSDEYSWSLAKNPLLVSEWIIGDQLRSGYKPTAKLVCLLLQLFVKNCQIGKHQGYADKAVLDMTSFLEEHTTFNAKAARARDDATARRVAVDEDMISLLAKGLCVAGHEEGVLTLLSELSQKGSGVSITAKSYEPVVYNYAVVMGKLSVANDIVTAMLNKNLPLSTRIVDALVAGTVQTEGPADALDDLQTLFTQHGSSARPSAGALLNLIDFSLSRGDTSEASRVVSVIDQMFTADERSRSVSGDIDRVSLDDMSSRAARRHAERPSRYGVQYDSAQGDEDGSSALAAAGAQRSCGVNPLTRRIGVLTKEALSERISTHRLK